jgi:type VI secretion system secreted protein Hcp
MSVSGYLTIKGAKQGTIKGDVTEKGREGSIAVTIVSSQIDTPIDPDSGAATGKRRHQPIAITKLIDQTTPKLYEAIFTNETLTDVAITFWRPLKDGSVTHYFTITLANAIVVGITFTSPDSQDPATAAPYEKVQLVYEKITLTWIDGGITAQDSWKSQ